MTYEDDVKRMWDGIEQTKGGKVLSMVLPSESEPEIKPSEFFKGFGWALLGAGVMVAVIIAVTFALEAK